MKKGFTLIELLAVITLLGIVALIAVPTIDSIFNSSKQQARDILIKEIEDAAKSWSSFNLNELNETGEPTCISVRTLIDQGYIDQDRVVDPFDESKSLNGSIYISYSDKYKSYMYNYGNASCSN